VTKSLNQISFNHYAVKLNSKNILDRFIDNDVVQRFLFSRDVIINRRSLKMRQRMNSMLIIVRFKNELEWRQDEKLENIIYLCDFIFLDLIIYIICNYVNSFITKIRFSLKMNWEESMYSIFASHWIMLKMTRVYVKSKWSWSIFN
jgi:hypothetical protein